MGTVAEERREVAPVWLRASELPKVFPVFRSTTWTRVLASGEVPSRRIGGARVVKAADVEAWLAGEEVGR